MTLISIVKNHFGRVSYTQDHNQNFDQYWTVNTFNFNGCFYTLNLQLFNHYQLPNSHCAWVYRMTDQYTHSRC